MFEDFIALVHEIYPASGTIPLHTPCFSGNERKYMGRVIDSTFVSSVGEYVDWFEFQFAEFIKTKFAIATVNGTAALHIALKLAGVKSGDEVITQPLTFVATCNAIKYCQAEPVFVDVDRNAMGMSAQKLAEFLYTHSDIDTSGLCVNRTTGRIIRACVPMHTFGHPVDIEHILSVCSKYNIVVVEDATEALGTYFNKQHTGTFGLLSAFSFNGNKIITTGGGGMIVTDDEKLAKRSKHLTTTSKLPHRWEYYHDEIGYNYRMPNLNAALGCAQLERLSDILASKRAVAMRYREFFKGSDIHFISELPGTHANYWLNAIVLTDRCARDRFLEATNAAGVMTRPIWELMNRLSIYKNCFRDNLDNAVWLADRVVNIPSSATI